MSDSTNARAKNMRDKFEASNFDEVDMVLDTDRRFDEAIAAADQGEDDLVDAIVKEMQECETINVLGEDDVIEYNPECDDAIGVLDTTAEDIREYVSEDYDDDENGEIIDSIMNGESYEDEEE